MSFRTISAVLGNSQRLDGGAMFGNAPRALWSRWIQPDDANRIPLACRAMLIHDGERNVLCETGIGAFFAPELRERYGVVEPNHVLLESLRGLGLTHADIDVVVLSHLHFDHAGGLLSSWEPGPGGAGNEPDLLFPNAAFLVSAEAVARAKTPHPRDRASFVPGLIEKLEASGRLEVVEGATSDELGPGYRLLRSDGHTPGLMLLEVELGEGPVVFAADLIPGRPWVHLPITMGYDRNPELLIDEKAKLLADLVLRGGRLFYTHDHQVAMSRVRRDPSGRYIPYDEVANPVELSA